MFLKYLKHTEDSIYRLEDIEFRIIYSGRRTLGISVLPDSSVVVRAPYHASYKTISRIVKEKSAWIIKHRDNYKKKESTKLNSSFVNGDVQLFRGKEHILKIIESPRPFIRFLDNTIEIGLEHTDDRQAIKRLLYTGYKTEASKVFFEILGKILSDFENKMFKPTGLVIRSMKSRWGSCSKKGIITLSTELVKLSDKYIEYVIIHELCHLKHHNHGKDYYHLLSELFPEWKKVRKELRGYIH